eukprot:jgi/Galph1/1435/GphlegSOOS_G114.1
MIYTKLENLCQTYQERIQTLESELYLLVTGDTSQTFSLKQLRARNADWKRRSPGQQDLKLPALWEERLNKNWHSVFEGELFKLRQEIIERLINQSDNVPQSVDKVDNIITAELQRISRATFDDLIEMLPYLEYLGFRNLYLLPHYESPLADGGYDVRQNLGGHEAYLRFMKAALAKQEQNKKKYIEYYLKRNGRKKIGEYERDGDIICQYQDPDQTISERYVFFRMFDRTHGLLNFYPFQVDLDLRNVAVLEEIFHILGNEMNE